MRISLQKFVALGIGTLVVASALPSTAQTIVSDSFGGASGDTLANRTPGGTNLPARNFIVTTNAVGPYAEPSIDTGVGNSAPSAQTGFNGSTYINVASNGTYILLPTLTLSADIQLGSIVAAAGNNYRGVGLGFFTAPGTGTTLGSNIQQEVSTNFTGLTVNPDGTLRLVTPNSTNASGNGIASTTFVAPAPAGFDKNNFYNLTYTIDTTTGSITNVSYNGVNDTANFAGVTAQPGFQYTAASTGVYTGFYGSTDTNPVFTGHVDNFSVTGVVPEPAAISMVSLGAASLLVRRRRA